MTYLETLLQDKTAGDPITGVKWTRKTLDKLAHALTTRRLLEELECTLRTNRKRLSKCQDVDRDRQMRYIVRQPSFVVSENTG